MATIVRGGTLYFKIDGTQYDLAGSFKIDIGGFTYEGQVGLNGPLGPKSSWRKPMWDVELADGQGVLVANLQAILGSTLTAQLSNGKTYTLTQAFVEGAVELDAGAANVKLKFSGQSCQEW